MKIPPANRTAGRQAREILGSTVGKATSTDPTTARTVESLRRSTPAPSQSTSQSSSKPSQYGGGQEVTRQQARERMVIRRRGGSRADDVLREEFTRVQETIEEEIEERQDILGTSGGSSDATTIVGDDFDEEVTQVGGVTVYDKIMDVATPNGYIEFLGLHSIKLNAPENTAQAQYVEDNQTKKGFIAYRVLRVTTGNPPDTRTLFDYYFLTAMPEPSLSAGTGVYIYSQEEEEFINSKIKSGDLPNLEDVRNLMQSYFQIDENPKFEGSIITNRLESTKKIKLSSL